jgi:hypothetical protein
MKLLDYNKKLSFLLEEILCYHNQVKFKIIIMLLTDKIHLDYRTNVIT